jgi:hypothetical protein
MRQKETKKEVKEYPENEERKNEKKKNTRRGSTTSSELLAFFGNRFWTTLALIKPLVFTETSQSKPPAS